MRTTFLDYYAHRNPKTDHYCCMCQRDLNQKKQFRTVRVSMDMMVLHPGDYDTTSSRLFEKFAIGMDCAKRLGLEWSVAHDEKD